jgi:hypothetical protein
MPEWRVRGHYWDVCTCPVPCPHWIGQSPPADSTCRFLKIYQVESGRYHRVNLTDCVVALVGSLAGHVEDGQYDLGLYISQEASDEQAAALERIMRGKVGGPMTRVLPRVAVYRGAKRVPFDLRPYPGESWIWELGTYGRAAGAPMRGAHGKPQIIQNAALAPAFGMTSDPVIGKHRVLRVNDPEWGYDYEAMNRSVYTMTFTWSGETDAPGAPA